MRFLADDSIKVEFRLPRCVGRLAVYFVLLYRRLRYGYAFRRIPLTKGKYAIVDADDYYRLAGYKWHARKAYYTYYASRNSPRRPGVKSKPILMHREVLTVAAGLVVDHINRNGLNNRKANLRPATFSQNNYNRRKNLKPTSSKYKGVYRHRHKKWRAMIKVNKKNMHLGSFDDEAEAARAYDEAARKYHGDFAVTNLP